MAITSATKIVGNKYQPQIIGNNISQLKHNQKVAMTSATLTGT